MNPTEREQARLSLLRYLAANRGRFGMVVAMLRQYLAAEGSLLSPAEIEAELVYLADKEMVAETTKSISPENRAWRITAAGRDYLAQVQGD